MKKIIILALILAIYPKYDSIGQILNQQSNSSTIAENKVILYSTSWCINCEKARKLLRKNKIDYHEYDIEKSAIGRKQHEDLGARGVPILLINDKIVRGYNKNKILRLLNKNSKHPN